MLFKCCSSAVVLSAVVLFKCSGMTECSECNGTIDAKSEDAVCCSICQSRIHMDCFLKGTSLDSENSTSTRATRKHSVTSLTSDTIKATLSSKCVLVLCDKCKSSGDIINKEKKR